MAREIPELTKSFMAAIKEDAKKGIVRHVLGDILIDAFPFVYPPYSKKSGAGYKDFRGFRGKRVLDLGTGTGILAIRAALKGAEHIHAVDIFQGAVDCAEHNVKLNGLERRISVYHSDLFSRVPKARFDVIIANLPILDLPQDDIRFHSLFDPGFEYHRRLFRDAHEYLSKNGRILLIHSNLLDESDFPKLENLAARHGYSFNIKRRKNKLGYEWRDYEFFLRKFSISC